VSKCEGENWYRLSIPWGFFSVRFFQYILSHFLPLWLVASVPPMHSFCQNITNRQRWVHVWWRSLEIPEINADGHCCCWVLFTIFTGRVWHLSCTYCTCSGNHCTSTLNK
jgi:hypothetical protein